jgi:hypothetical protein
VSLFLKLILTQNQNLLNDFSMFLFCRTLKAVSIAAVLNHWPVIAFSATPHQTVVQLQPKCFPKRQQFVSYSNKRNSEPEVQEEYVNDLGISDEIPDDILDELNAGQPSELLVMQDVSAALSFGTILTIIDNT